MKQRIKVKSEEAGKGIGIKKEDEGTSRNFEKSGT